MTTDPPRRTAPDRALPLAFVADLDAPELTPGDRHHLERVRRLRAGDALTVGDGAGRWRVVTFRPTLEPTGEVVGVAAPTPALTVAVALVKGERPEWAVQKLTEVGVDRIVLFAAARSVVRWDAASAARNVVRLRAVARQAAAQCHRPWLAEVADLATFATVAALPGAVLAHPDGAPPTLARPSVLVGPEGGWSPEEEAAVSDHVVVGAHVLRAETAAVVAGALLAALRAGTVAER